jgi:FdhD protein
MVDTVAPIRTIGRLAWHRGAFTAGSREIPEELPVALSFNRVSHAVMMATPADLEDFARGFSLSEEIVASASEIEEIETVILPGADGGPPRGIDLRVWIAADRMDALDARRRHVAGPTGCGMCGLESLDAALRPPRSVPAGRRFTPDAVQDAVGSLRPAQHLNHRTRAVHAAGFWTEAGGLVALREDVGRHNALDKLHGALSGQGGCLSEGILLMTSRISVELVQKASIMGVSILAAVSAPTALALRVAEQAGITLIAVAREDGFEICTGAQRIIGADPSSR